MMRPICNLVLLSLLLAPSAALAAPITAGTWSPVGAVNADGFPFWDGASNDCQDCGVAEFLVPFGPLEYLHDGSGAPVPFVFPEAVPWTRLFALSITPGVFGQRADGAFTYETDTVHDSNSVDQPGQFALFRQVGSSTIRYFVAVEDLRLDIGPVPSDRDYNDYVATFREARAVPEPATLLLMGGAMLVGVARLRMRKP
jgi:hypothetical protein